MTVLRLGFKRVYFEITVHAALPDITNELTTNSKFVSNKTKRISGIRK
jgi:hypothetical protein